MKTAKEAIQSLLSRLGVQLRKIPSKAQIYFRRKSDVQWLLEMNIQTVLDIGANTGQFVESIYDLLPAANIYSFEPLPECFEELTSKFSGNSQFKAFNFALGNETSETIIYRNDYSPSSSLLPMADLHKESYPFTKNETPTRVKIERLDNVRELIDVKLPMLVKVDVQGFEDQVIEGGVQTFKEASVVIIEMSIEELYKGQVLFDGIYQRLKDLGFSYHGNYSQSYCKDSNRILHIDGIFIRH
jgi:FkbM family methyltransferase